MLICIFTVPLLAIDAPYITGTSTATLITEGDYTGWYFYQIEFEWDLDAQGAGLSHWNLILKTDCASPDHLIELIHQQAILPANSIQKTPWQWAGVVISSETETPA